MRFIDDKESSGYVGAENNQNGSNAMNAEYLTPHELKIRRAVRSIAAFLSLAVLALLLPFVDAFRPAGESVATWWQRAGAPVAVFAFIAQNKSQYLGALLTPGSFTSAAFESLRGKYRRTHQMGLSAAIALTVLGTVVWGYGDCFIKAVEQAQAKFASHKVR
ncbi:hypothetical protein PI87_02755 [Ralstonia sp. A12]|uniref:hypothetical protein n=1 Tax=Ralstonia sp. A12 TaxID=1217052 RepID=UPI0005739CF7|nr:hypothetical protein [Ralstonia sp. A12]KHK58678.1 hypothetical protein PI87_02755 [Ralstonia sp. A12]